MMKNNFIIIIHFGNSCEFFMMSLLFLSNKSSVDNDVMENHSIENLEEITNIEQISYDTKLSYQQVFLYEFTYKKNIDIFVFKTFITFSLVLQRNEKITVQSRGPHRTSISIYKYTNVYFNKPQYCLTSMSDIDFSPNNLQSSQIHGPTPYSHWGKFH